MDDFNIYLENVFEKKKSQTIAKETGQETITVVQNCNNYTLNQDNNNKDKRSNSKYTQKVKLEQYGHGVREAIDSKFPFWLGGESCKYQLRK